MTETTRYKAHLAIAKDTKQVGKSIHIHGVRLISTRYPIVTNTEQSMTVFKHTKVKTLPGLGQLHALGMDATAQARWLTSKKEKGKGNLWQKQLAPDQHA